MKLRQNPKREHVYKIRLSDDERRRLQILADKTDLTIASLIRYVFFNSSHDNDIPNAKEIQKSLFCLSNISNNINQSVKALNRSVKLQQVDYHDANKLIDELRESQSDIDSSIKNLRKEIRKISKKKSKC
jgi:vacuolar-type H+-ATPase subunit I/STV1